MKEKFRKSYTTSAFGNKVLHSNNLQFQNGYDEGKTRSGVKVDIGRKNLYPQRNQ